MAQLIYPSMYKDIPALTMENDDLKVQFTPGFGGKMVSFIDKKSAREFLRQREDPVYRKLDYDGDYVQAECSGFDDMFPTIDRIAYPSFPWKGVEMADHGEVCGLKWQAEAGKDSLHMMVHGVRFPYRLEKRVSLGGGRTLDIKYKAANLSQFDMDFLWAAHIMVDPGSGGEIAVPGQGNRKARVVITSDDKLASYGDLLAWPVAAGRDGREQAIHVVGPAEDRIGLLKYYFEDRMPEGRCSYRYHGDGTCLSLSFSKETVPYLGILISRKYGLILEPCTATMDRPDMSRFFSQYSVLPALGEYEWQLSFSVEHEGAHF